MEPIADSPTSEPVAESTPVPASTPRIPSGVALVVLAFLAGLGAGFIVWGGRPAPTSLSSPAAERVPVSADDDPSLGPSDAAVTIIEFSDFTCPYCRKFQNETFPALRQAYPDEIRFVYRDYPILSAESSSAAAAAECAADQGQFWPFHDSLFVAQLGLGRQAYLSYAEILELDMSRFTDCVDSGRHADEVQADAQDAARWGITGTPTFFINGIRLVGAQPLSAFVSIIDAELER
ncbi:MAG: thioredoxin domain-containing protein [Anaerolineales bacterium]